jgi:hypothetical protein
VKIAVVCDRFWHFVAVEGMLQAPQITWFLLRLENVFSFCMRELGRFLIAALLRLDFWLPSCNARVLLRRTCAEEISWRGWGSEAEGGSPDALNGLELEATL